ncbi:AEC family transporter [Granulosicoccus antarcticus]|uniref:Transporter YfdV n=1 Tax=Granulosicoccus antarcticus IMCC3135 TaxID=1192854 RepID=A0A2Z2NXR9_9GAMM|nr:AEC family transporter [Granulosicoccus antarcticus]ASJ76256.1 hypothetical protein IMCC3135_31035 [Granulosicoccus antarcticus IMCC3135]
MFDSFVFAFGITGPILLLLMVGWGICRIKLVDTHFIAQANALVFNVTLPVMLFFAIAGRSFNEALDLPLTLIGLGGTLILVALLLLVGRLIPLDQRGVFVQGSYRGNLAILGVALAVATYGEEVLPLVAVYIALVTTVYNIIAVWVLNSSGVLRNLLKNPILIGIMAGVLASLINLPVPEFLRSTGNYLTGMTLPLALICIGATLDFNSLFGNGRTILLAVFFKLIVSPLILVGLGLLFGLGSVQIGILFFLAASPTATASYIMARQMTAHGALAAEIVAVTTALGVLSYTAGIALLRAYGLI